MDQLTRSIPLITLHGLTVGGSVTTIKSSTPFGSQDRAHRRGRQAELVSDVILTHRRYLRKMQHPTAQCPPRPTRRLKLATQRVNQPAADPRTFRRFLVPRQPLASLDDMSPTAFGGNRVGISSARYGARVLLGLPYQRRARDRQIGRYGDGAAGGNR